MRTSLTRFQPVTPMDDDELRAKAAKLWHETGTLMVNPNWLRNDIDKQMAKTIGEKMYGRRK